MTPPPPTSSPNSPASPEDPTAAALPAAQPCGQTAGGAGHHTPGPWRFYQDGPSVEPNWHIVTNDDRMRLLANIYIEPGNRMDLANAHLIAAAPDLLAALKRLTQAVEYTGSLRGELGSAIVIEACNAIAKAEGGHRA